MNLTNPRYIYIYIMIDFFSGVSLIQNSFLVLAQTSLFESKCSA